MSIILAISQALSALIRKRWSDRLLIKSVAIVMATITYFYCFAWVCDALSGGHRYLMRGRPPFVRVCSHAARVTIRDP